MHSVVAKVSMRPFVDKALGGQLDHLLRTWRGQGDSLAEITYRLRDEHDIKVSTATVFRWLRDMEAA